MDKEPWFHVADHDNSNYKGKEQKKKRIQLVDVHDINHYGEQVNDPDLQRVAFEK